MSQCEKCGREYDGLPGNGRKVCARCATPIMDSVKRALTEDLPDPVPTYRVPLTENELSLAILALKTAAAVAIDGGQDPHEFRCVYKHLEMVQEACEPELPMRMYG